MPLNQQDNLRYLFNRISTLLEAINNCQKSCDTSQGEQKKHWEAMMHLHSESLDYFINRYMPSGSGYDNSTELDAKSTPEKLVFNTSFHHMNEHGYYTKWTDHSVIVTASLSHQINIKVTGRDYRDIKSIISEDFYTVLTQKVDYREGHQKVQK